MACTRFAEEWTESRAGQELQHNSFVSQSTGFTLVGWHSQRVMTWAEDPQCAVHDHFTE